MRYRPSLTVSATAILLIASVSAQSALAEIAEKDNFILDTDSYKVSHEIQYPPGTESMFAYLESRGGKFDKTLFFGLQYILREYLSRPITEEMVNQAAGLFSEHFGSPEIFQQQSWLKLIKKHPGSLPLRIRAFPEGTVVPTGVPLLTVESTDPEFFWLPGWFETQIMRVWYPTTVATLSYHAKKVIQTYLNDTADPSDPSSNINFKLHDFGARGVSSAESAGIGGAAHLVNFLGSDTIKGITFARHYYDSMMAMPAFSIAAAEHSTVTSWVGESSGEALKPEAVRLEERRSKETEAYANMLAKFGRPGALVAVVSDSYDIYYAVSEIWGGTLKQKVIDSGASLIIRPDSGNAVEVISRLLDILEAKFGVDINSKKFKVIKHNVRLIQGDGVDLEAIEAILAMMKAKQFSSTNIAFGMGGGLLQKVDRDTQKFAYKTSSVRVAGRDRDVYKDPVTDPGKKSKKGRMDVIYNPATRSYQVEPLPEGITAIEGSALVEVYLNGELKNQQKFEEVKARAVGVSAF